MKKVSLFITALMLGLTLTTTAGTPKGETKEPKKAEASVASATSVNLHWYKVTYNATYPNGAILSETDFEDVGEKEDITSPCPAGNNQDCLRAFEDELQAFPETMLPSSEDARIRKQ